ncbi:hypothetical protein MUO32_08025 [Shinella sp. CPCC 101442]|uniref:hypothetical protein n=1 Tax=Shinella sp. CPCC 101442 TaxID=2932265 RepID=UPI002153A6FE|nr:hypothetical protein [Shinella sp. CPCC 101442]MCR6498974.1 hypothetical protein [Shinella sp. CPCC 101442]
MRRISRRAKREFSVALMSDTKWRKVFRAWANVSATETQMIVKFLDVPEPRVMRLPGESALSCPKPYIDSLEYGPWELCALEWLEIPVVASWPRQDDVPPPKIAQEIGALRAAIDFLGQLPLTETEQGLRLEGYRR